MEGNCDVLSLPRRDHTRTTARGVAGSISTTRANAVVLGFEDEMRAGEGRIGKSGEHRRAPPGFSRQITERGDGKEGQVDYRVFGD